MRSLLLAAGTVFLALLCARGTQAATMVSPPILVEDGTGTRPMESLLCFIFNGGTTPVQVEKIEPLNREGVSVGFVPDPFTLDPGQTGAGGPAVGANRPIVCRFTVKGSKAQLRASACITGTFTDKGRRFCIEAH